MANTYTNHGFLNFENGAYTDVLNEAKFISELSTPFVEYTTDTGVNARLMATIILSNLKAGNITLKMEKEIEISTGVWVNTPIADVKSNRDKFANAQGVEVPREEALSYDEVNEVYTLNEGYTNEFDGVFVSYYFKGAGVISDYVFQALAKQIEVTIP
jgi:hypothetical protein